jgi:FdhD protein
LLSSRCSYELVEKTVIAGCPLLVTISTATTLAADRAAAAGLKLIALARPDAMLDISGPR